MSAVRLLADLLLVERSITIAVKHLEGRAIVTHLCTRTLSLCLSLSRMAVAPTEQRQDNDGFGVAAVVRQARQRTSSCGACSSGRLLCVRR